MNKDYAKREGFKNHSLVIEVVSVVTISIEIELGWGVHDVEQWHKLSPDRQAETHCLNQLLDICDDFGVPISFDIVGHLFKNNCEGIHEGPHPDNWWDADPGTNKETDPWFYAPDLLDAIDDSSTTHEICTHSFSHVDCDEACNDIIRWDLEQAQKYHEERYGTRTKSFVPPKHREPPTSVLHEKNIRIIRKALRRNQSKISKLKEYLFGPLPNKTPKISDDISVTYCTSYPSLTSPLLPQGTQNLSFPFKHLPLTEQNRQQLHTKKLIKAVEDTKSAGQPLHLWTHLYNLSNQSQLEAISDFFQYLHLESESSRLTLITMEDLNNYIREYYE